jgi:general secretion pathway protein H
MRARHGFSMIELLIVLVIIATASALVIPMFGKGVSTTELKSAARQLASGLRLARAGASRWTTTPRNIRCHATSN